mmetsp:Transcript_18208/g.37545  ORF Transcript_18208/g.37545 Transcript_18208/m.37545 type:complete len:84 (+) Transcript_18208:73-324(+)
MHSGVLEARRTHPRIKDRSNIVSSPVCLESPKADSSATSPPDVSDCQRPTLVRRYVVALCGCLCYCHFLHRYVYVATPSLAYP